MVMGDGAMVMTIIMKRMLIVMMMILEMMIEGLEIISDILNRMMQLNQQLCDVMITMISKYITNVAITLSNDILAWTNINNIHRHHDIILILIIKICEYVVGRDSIHYENNLNQINKYEYHNIINII
jgi:hypothetical protein